jgi:predicted DNA-binding protein
MSKSRKPRKTQIAARLPASLVSDIDEHALRLQTTRTGALEDLIERGLQDLLLLYFGRAAVLQADGAMHPGSPVSCTQRFHPPVAPQIKQIAARLPAGLVSDIDEHARHLRTTRTGALEDLIERGLQDVKLPGTGEAAALQELNRRGIALDELGSLLDDQQQLRRHGLTSMSRALRSLYTQHQQDRAQAALETREWLNDGLRAYVVCKYATGRSDKEIFGKIHDLTKKALDKLLEI